MLSYTCKLVRFVYAERDFAYLALNTYSIIVVDAELRPSSRVQMPCCQLASVQKKRHCDQLKTHRVSSMKLTKARHRIHLTLLLSC
jgi:hypothetical protein